MVALPDAPALHNWRCPHCRALLARMALPAGGVVEVKCGRCGRMATQYGPSVPSMPGLLMPDFTK